MERRSADSNRAQTRASRRCGPFEPAQLQRDEMKQRLITRLTSRAASLWVQSLTPKVVFASKSGIPISEESNPRLGRATNNATANEPPSLQTTHPRHRQLIRDPNDLTAIVTAHRAPNDSIAAQTTHSRLKQSAYNPNELSAT
ncbi:hypothetical protein HYDPIDRAFT_28295 [Hydnomerulius pinastri MD-312]|uniref:Uncharacterized protein n=1 Tax=Hydnomerulius pinastri MD-312 TaxID=994086 RepID=A0A0C9WG78_9AGAM|nr:hypothetical protein HYDPIDRAFT_28295 [Hydnomerulius pinastri MD-312]